VDTVWYRPQVSTLWWLTIALIASYHSIVPQPNSMREIPSAQTEPGLQA
jgi:putative inorganic carbon (hco3(-)) transporter